MNTLLEGPSCMAFYCDLRLMFEAFAGRQKEFNWLITDLDSTLFLPPFELKRPIWLSGQLFTEVVEQHDIQFIWAVCSGFPMDVSLDLDHLDPEPYADGNRALWRPDVTIQHPLAVVELICWDGTAVLLLSKDDDLTRGFRDFLPKAVDLDAYNRQHYAPRDEPYS